MPDNDTLPTGHQPAIRVLAMPADTNASGDIFDGWLMSQVDIAGSIEAFRRAGGRIVTVAVNEFRFLQPVYVGDLISLYSRLIKIGTTSIRIHITAFAERTVARTNATRSRKPRSPMSPLMRIGSHVRSIRKHKYRQHLCYN